MKKAAALVPLLVLALLAGCSLSPRRPPPGPPPAAAALAGVWEDPDTRDRHTIRWVRGRFTVTNVESSSGERYVVSDVQWRDGVLRWGFHIPSVQYVITLRTVEVSRRTLRLDWSDSDGNTREEILRRVDP
jgi:hypothetical protein